MSIIVLYIMTSFIVIKLFRVTLILPTKILERVMLSKRFVGAFRQCKQSLGNKGLQLSSRNNKSRLKIS